MIFKTCCARMDHGGCGLLIHVEGGKIIKVEGDPDSPLSRGYLCAKGLAQMERINHPDRLQFPLKRAGKKGEGKWERISWEEAIQTIAEKIRETIARGGERAVSFAQGTPQDLELSGWKESNLNILTSSDPPYEPAIGSTTLRGVFCRVSKLQEDANLASGD
jgi:anaerobic selenocysteine-containing dehydrogenase